MSFLKRLFGGRESSKNVARQRLQFLLLHDRVSLTPGQMDSMKREIIDVIVKYVDVDMSNVDIDLRTADSNVSLVSNIPLKRSAAREARRAV